LIGYLSRFGVILFCFDLFCYIVEWVDCFAEV